MQDLIIYIEYCTAVLEFTIAVITLIILIKQGKL